MLYLQEEVTLAKLLAAIPGHVKIVNLSGNSFGNIGKHALAKLAAGFAALHPEVTELHLADNSLGLLTVAQLVELFKSIPSNIKTITLGFDDIRSRSVEDIIALGESLSTITTIHVIGSGGLAVNHPHVTLLKNHLRGGCIMETYHALKDLLPLSLVHMTMPQDHNGPPEQLKQFINKKQEEHKEHKEKEKPKQQSNSAVDLMAMHGLFNSLALEEQMQDEEQMRPGMNI